VKYYQEKYIFVLFLSSIIVRKKSLINLPYCCSAGAESTKHKTVAN
jgi:hypothetical protein